eukprot:jgi/Botrbrau1/7373/Bobra.0316s0017.1
MVKEEKLDLASSLFGYVAPERGGTPSREVLRWVQRLDLSYSISSPRRVLSNGFVVGEILNRYFPADAPTSAFTTGQSLPSKATNWEYIERICQRRSISLPPNLVQGTQRERPGAAAKLLEHLYEQLTKRTIERLPKMTQPKEKASQLPKAVGAAAGPAPPGELEVESAATVGAKPIATAAGGAGEVQFGVAHVKSAGNASDLHRRLQASAA